MGRRKFRLGTQKKNEERKRWGFFPIRIPLRIVRVPHLSFPIHISREAFKNAPAPSVSTLRTRITLTKSIPNGWSVHVGNPQTPDRLEMEQTTLNTVLTVDSTFKWSFSCHGQHVPIPPVDSSQLHQVPASVSSVAQVEQILTAINQLKVCEGNADEQFTPLCDTRDGIFTTLSGKEVVAKHDKSMGLTTIRHVKCNLLVPMTRTRCTFCTQHRKVLLVLVKRHDNTTSVDRAAPTSHVNYRFLSSEEKTDRLKRLPSVQRSTKQQMEYLRGKLSACIKDTSTTVSPETNADLETIFQENTPHIRKSFPENSFERLFWEQQEKAHSVKDQRQMRWHPLIIRWCLYLRHLSGKAYDTIRNTGCIALPSQRTLRDYTYHIKPHCGFSADLDRELMRCAKLPHCPVHQRNVALIIDEMHVKEDLVYDKISGELIGFTNIGDINTHLLQFQASLESDSQDERLAKTVLVFMVRGLFSNMEFPFAQFPLSTTTGDLMFNLIWEAVSRIELCGLRVLAVTGDGASPKRRLFKIHKPKSKMTYKVVNPYAPDRRHLFFFSDPPHLLKTIRNCFASKARYLWCNGKEIKWEHIARLYKQGTGHQMDTPCRGSMLHSQAHLRTHPPDIIL